MGTAIENNYIQSVSYTHLTLPTKECRREQLRCLETIKKKKEKEKRGKKGERNEKGRKKGDQQE
uniref:hypothetical protein n=1 Tax=Escherichia coli TaxID=562 RepID=UPI001BC871B0